MIKASDYVINCKKQVTFLGSNRAWNLKCLKIAWLKRSAQGRSYLNLNISMHTKKITIRKRSQLLQLNLQEITKPPYFYFYVNSLLIKLQLYFLTSHTTFYFTFTRIFPLKVFVVVSSEKGPTWITCCSAVMTVIYGQISADFARDLFQKVLVVDFFLFLGRGLLHHLFELTYNCLISGCRLSTTEYTLPSGAGGYCQVSGDQVWCVQRVEWRFTYEVTGLTYIKMSRIISDFINFGEVDSGVR